MPIDDTSAGSDHHIAAYVDVIQSLIQGAYDVEIPIDVGEPLEQLGSALRLLAVRLAESSRKTESLVRITQQINSGLLLEEILDYIYTAFQGLLPYNRIGFALIENPGPQATVRAYWAKSDQPHVYLRRGYTTQVANSSLQWIVETGQPRIINDLATYAAQRPESESTRLILSEGIHSSLTCPLISNGVPVGFIFFSSTEPGAYANSHVTLFQQIAGQLATILEKGRYISEIVSHRAEIERQNRELQKLNELKNSFVGMAAHDLRTPLHNIHFASELLLMENLDLSPAAYHEVLNDIRQQVNYMVTLINDLLDVSQIESGNLQLELAPVDVADLCQETIARHSKLAAPKGSEVKLTLVPAGMVPADRNRLRQVMDNLLSNAVKYSPARSTVRLQVARIERFWHFEIQDEGPGISLADQQRLFQDFARLSARPTGGEKSTGLGLSISRRIVTAHGGEIGVCSEPGLGTTFWFTLPAG